MSMGDDALCARRMRPKSARSPPEDDRRLLLVTLKIGRPVEAISEHPSDPMGRLLLGGGALKRPL